MLTEQARVEPICLVERVAVAVIDTSGGHWLVVVVASSIVMTRRIANLCRCNRNRPFSYRINSTESSRSPEVD